MLSRREYLQFFSSLGFDENPFAFTNADEEDRLPQYFVPPPYFDSVFGNPERPKTFIVFAPRGGGKSAQRRMVESKSADNKVLAITYDQFEYQDITKVSEIRLHHHLRKIIRFVLIGLLFNLHSQPETQTNLTKLDKQVFLKLAAEHLGNIKGAELTQALDSLKSLKDKFQDFWNEWLPAIGFGVQAIIKLLKPIEDLGDNISNLTRFQDPEFRTSESLYFQLKLLVELAQKLGWVSIYILIDRVDEASITSNNAKDSFVLLEPLLRELKLLEFPGLAFKFFLWDQLEPLCDDVVRTDRVRQEVLDWDDAMLRQMWERRLKAFSAKRVHSLQQISETLLPFSVDDLCLIFANQSPRDFIRIGDQILSEQQELDPSSQKISEQAVYRGLEKFCTQRASEVIRKERVLQELKKVRQIDFTIPYLANIVFKEKQSSTRNRMIMWRDEAAIIEIERIEDPQSKQERPVKLFGIKDVRVAKEIYPELTVPEFLKKKHRKCPRCGTIVLRDWGDNDSSSICQFCQFDLSSTNEDEFDIWRRKAMAMSKKKKYREDNLSSEAIQLSFSDVGTEED